MFLSTLFCLSLHFLVCTKHTGEWQYHRRWRKITIFAPSTLKVSFESSCLFWSEFFRNDSGESEPKARTECRCERNFFLHLRWYCHSPYVLYIRVTYTFLIIAFWILLEKNNYLLMRYACRLIFTHLCLNSPDIFYVCGTRSGILISSKVRTYVRIIYILSIPF